MTFDPLNDRYDIVITTAPRMEAGLKLNAGYHVQQYHKFDTREAIQKWLLLNVQKCRQKILFWCDAREVRYICSQYFEDLERAKPCFYGIYTEKNPKFLIGEFAVYSRHLEPYQFPIFRNGTNGVDFLIAEGETGGLYRAVHKDYIPKIAEEPGTHQMRIVLNQ